MLNINNEVNTWCNNNLKNQVLETFNKDVEFIVFDTETSGLESSKGDVVIQFSAIKLLYKPQSEHKWFKKDEINLYIKPMFTISDKITEITGITNKFLSTKPVEKDQFPKIKEFMGNDSIIVGQNVDFDIGFMSQMYKRQGDEFSYSQVFDTLEMARDCVSPDELPFEMQRNGQKKLNRSYKLENIYKALCNEETLQFHDSSADIIATGKIFKKMVERYQFLQEIDIKYNSNFLVKVNKVTYNQNKYRKTDTKIFIMGNFGCIYFSPYYKRFYSYTTKQGKTTDVALLNMNEIEKQVFSMTGKTTYKELSKFKGDVDCLTPSYEQLKMPILN